VFALQSYKRKKGRKAGDLSRALIDTTDNSTFVSNVKSVVVRSTSEQEKNYEVEMRKLEMVREKEAQKEEKRAISNVNPDSENGVERFLNEALETDNVSASDTFPIICSLKFVLQSSDMLRKANILTHSRQNARAGYGWTLEGMLVAEGQAGVVAIQHGRSTDETGGSGTAKLKSPAKSPGANHHSKQHSRANSPSNAGSSHIPGSNNASPMKRRPTTAGSTMSGMGMQTDNSEEDSQANENSGGLTGAGAVNGNPKTPSKSSPRKTMMKTPMTGGSRSRASSKDV
jgi:hypothetical protein